MPLQHAGPRTVLQEALLLKKIAIKKCVQCSPSGDKPVQKKPTTNTIRRRTPCRNPSVHTHKHTETTAYLSKIIWHSISLQILWITWRHRVIYLHADHCFCSCLDPPSASSASQLPQSEVSDRPKYWKLSLPADCNIWKRLCQLIFTPGNGTIWYLKLCFHFWRIMHIPQLPSQMCHPTAIPFFFKLQFGILLSEHDSQ